MHDLVSDKICYKNVAKVMELGRSRECLQFSKYQFRSRTNEYVDKAR